MAIDAVIPDDILEQLRTIGAVGADVSTELQRRGTPPACDGVLTDAFPVSASAAAIREQLASFPQRWFGQTFRHDDQELVFRITLPTSFWRRLIGQRAGLEARVRLRHDASADRVRVETTVQPLAGAQRAGRALVEEMGPRIVADLRRLLGSDCERRTGQRLRWPHPLKITPVLPDGTHGAPISGCGKDISTTGLGFYLSEELTVSDVLIELRSTARQDSIVAPARLVRVKHCADGWYEVGALFRVASAKPAGTN